jgi:ABC-type molybdenum transport system ATPase subunit/photorepair protein PhrA
VADVIVRLIVASAVTDLPTVWFDEPLEHLDPRRRVALARTLVTAVEAGPLPSVVITTYEEHIARQLELTNPDLVTVAYATAARPLRAAGII